MELNLEQSDCDGEAASQAELLATAQKTCAEIGCEIFWHAFAYDAARRILHITFNVRVIPAPTANTSSR